MIKVSKFRISHRPYAVDLSSFALTWPGEGSRQNWASFDAVWFRRRRGVTVACIGQLRDYFSLAFDPTAEDALRAMDDGRYGGDCIARWDGQSYWANDPSSLSPEGIERHLAILRPMLENFPAIPRGYDGWWTYP